LLFLAAVVPEILLLTTARLVDTACGSGTNTCMHVAPLADLNNVPGVGVYAFLPKTRMQIREES
jgi:hypothetical protein